MANELWKNIEGYEGRYQVSNIGNVRSMWIDRSCRNAKHEMRISKFHRAHIMHQTDNGHGYLIVGLTKDGKRKNYYVHRLVAGAFIENPFNYEVVNHIDYNKKNNNATNLEWCEQKENIKHSVCNMSVQHNQVGKSGLRYISVDKKGLYRVCIKKADVDKRFKNVDDAIAFRNEVLYGIGYTI